ncbi:MAG: FKBP-type peptidyl-prolyl cis-trans isomerase [Nitrospirota bacterium]
MKQAVWGLVGVVGLLGVLPWGSCARAKDGLTVADGLVVTLEYTLTLPDQTVVDSNVGKDPLTFTQGAHQIVTGLEKALVGMKAGQSKRVEVSAVEGFGAYSMRARMEVEKSHVPADVKPGMWLQSADGRPVKVLEVKEETVVLDLNHPLAGKNLIFDVTVLKVEKPAPEASTEKP